jgi:hypothetical protein
MKWTHKGETLHFCPDAWAEEVLNEFRWFVGNETLSWICRVNFSFGLYRFDMDRLCGLVVRVLGYRSGGPGSIPGTESTQPREYNWGATCWKSSGSCLENREYGRRDLSRWPRGTLYPQKLEITSPTSGGRSVGIVRSRTQTMEFFLFRFDMSSIWHTANIKHDNSPQHRP